MNVLFFTRKVDSEDFRASVWDNWVNRIAPCVNKLNIICLEKGQTNYPSNVSVYELGSDKPKLIKILRFTKILSGLINDTDVIFTHQNTPYTLVSAPFSFIFQVPIVMWYAYGGVDIRLKAANRFATRAVTSSKDGFRIDSDKLLIVGQGIDVKKFKPIKTKESKIIKILSVGRISPEKKFEVLIDALGILASKGMKNLKLEIIGDVPREARDQEYFKSLKEYVKENGLEGEVNFLGSVPHENLPPHYASSDMFVNTSVTGSMDKVVLESMACGTPPLNCNEAFEEIFSPYKELLFFKKGDSHDLADKIQSLISMDRQKKHEILDYLRERVVQEHNIDNLIESFLEVFADLKRKP